MAGYFNINTSKSNETTVSKQYKDLLLSLGLTNLISKPTRIANSSETILDHILANVPLQKLNCGVVRHVVADHLPTFAILNSTVQYRSEHQNSYYRCVTDDKRNEFVEVFKKSNQALLMCDINPETDPEHDLSLLIDAITEAFNKVFPLRKRSKKLAKRYRKPWMTKGILASVKRKNELKFLWLKNKDDSSHQEYKKYLNKLTRIKEKAKNLFNYNDFYSCEGDSKKTWGKINKLLGKNKGRNCLPDKLIDRDLETTNAKQIANKLNKHFVQKRNVLASELTSSTNSIFDTMGPRVINELLDCIFEVKEVRQCIENLNINKASGFDNIPPKIIKWLAFDIAPILTIILNKFFKLGKYPDVFKTARVSALFKGGDKTNCDNYRPISVLPQLNVVFERLIKERLTSFLTENKILHKNQFGFQKGHSTAHAITVVNEHIIKNIEKQRVSALLLT